MTVKLEIAKKDGLFNLQTVYEALQLSDDGKYSLTIKPLRKTRTNDQNAWLWGCVYPRVLRGLIDAGWTDFTTVEQVHEFCKARFTKQSSINRDTGEIIEYPASTAKMDTVTFSTYVDNVRDFALEYLNTEIPSPDKYWRNNNI